MPPLDFPQATADSVVFPHALWLGSSVGRDSIFLFILLCKWDPPLWKGCGDGAGPLSSSVWPQCFLPPEHSLGGCQGALKAVAPWTSWQPSLYELPGPFFYMSQNHVKRCFASTYWNICGTFWDGYAVSVVVRVIPSAKLWQCRNPPKMQAMGILKSVVVYPKLGGAALFGDVCSKVLLATLLTWDSWVVGLFSAVIHCSGYITSKKWLSNYFFFPK